MNYSTRPPVHYGSERFCPHCGARVAQRATDCFYCGASLEDAPRPRRGVPWADITLAVVATAVILIWWLSPPPAPRQQSLALFDSPTATRVPKATATFTPAATATSTLAPTAAATPTPSRHAVANGETLDSIADDYGVSTEDLIHANNLPASGFIRAGDELLIPAASPSAVESEPPTATPEGGRVVHEVESGDTVASIAEQYHSQIAWILKANSLGENDILPLGRSLVVPLSEQAAEPATATPTPVPPPTATPGPRFRVPQLLAPAEGDVHEGSEGILLNWTSAGLLREDEWYVVTVTINSAGVSLPPQWTKATSWRLPAEYRAIGGSPGQFSWHVQVIAGQVGKPGKPLTAVSATRHFTWR